MSLELPLFKKSRFEDFWNLALLRLLKIADFKAP